MNNPVITLKWIDNDLRQIKITIADGEDSSEIVYPRLEACDEKEYGGVLTRMFDRIRGLFEREFGRLDFYGPYGVITFESSILENLLRWHEESNFVSVEELPTVAKRNLTEKIKQLVRRWALSNKHMDLERAIDEFAKSTVKNFRWLFDFEISTAPKSLFNINKDALELEWYVLNQDDVNVQRKFSELQDEVKGIGRYKAIQLMEHINAYVSVCGGNSFEGASHA